MAAQSYVIWLNFFAGSFPDFGIRSRNKVTLQKHTKVSTLNVDLWKCGYWLELHGSLSGHFYHQTILLFCQVSSSIFCFDSSGTSMANLPQTVSTNSYIGPWLQLPTYHHVINLYFPTASQICGYWPLQHYANIWLEALEGINKLCNLLMNYVIYCCLHYLITYLLLVSTPCTSMHLAYT